MPFSAHKLPLFLLSLAILNVAQAQDLPVDNVLLVTLDGLRWQEVFRGVDPALAASEEYNRLGPQLTELFGASGDATSAERLMPFLHEVVLKEGSVIGNRDAGSCARVTNPWFFSYPGYNEILTGVVDRGIDTNEAKPNPNVSVLEWLNGQPAFAGKVAAFASWDVFPAILNVERSGLPVNVGTPADAHNEMDAAVARLQRDLPVLWPTVRYDAFTHHYALSYLQSQHPRVLYVSYGETDDFAHDGHYEQVLTSANRSDRFLRELWDFVQSDAQYRDNTVMFITVDHGRGEAPLETWQHHASKESLGNYMKSLAQYEEGIVGSDAVWMAAIGPGIAAHGMIATADCAGSNQVAATLLQALGLDYKVFNPSAGAPLAGMLAP
jgi:hypothetical protein